MYVKIDNTVYNSIKNLSFSPDVDITSSKISINGFSADIITEDEPSTGVNIFLYDDRNYIWAKYRLIEAQKIDKNLIHIEAQSVLRILNRKKKGAMMYTNESVVQIMSALFSGTGSNSYYLDPSFQNKTIWGYCPKQTARERLQWVCFCIGAYIKSFFSDRIEILPIDNQQAAIPLQKVFWKPSVAYNDYVTSISVTAYNYTNGTPQTTDKWVKVGSSYYIETSQEFTLDNPNAPQDADENVVFIDNVTIIGQDNVSEILSRLSAYYFKRMVVDAEIINNRDYIPGEKVSLPLDDENMAIGFINSMNFSFGTQSKSRIRLSQIDVQKSATLTIIRKYSTTELRKDKYYLPLNYEYSIENPYLDITKSSKRRIYYPVNKYATGTISSTKTTNTQNYDIALEYSKKLLKIYSVDGIEVQTVSDNDIGVID